MGVPFVLSDTSASIFIDFVPYSVPKSHPNWSAILDTLADPNADEAKLVGLLDVAKAVSDYMDGLVEYRDRTVFFDGKSLDTGLTRRIIQHMETGNPAFAAPLVEFLKNVMQNPSRRAVQGLYEWVERAGLPITPDGYIIAYKVVDPNYLDKYTHKIDNSIGSRVEVPRYEVDEDPDKTCSYGLHVCSTGYLSMYGINETYVGHDHVIVCKVHPKDFVAVPRDYNTTKARVCGYDVIGEVPPEKAKVFFPNAHVWDPTEVEAAPATVLEVGQIWQTLGGELVKITAVDDEPEWDDDDNWAKVLVGPNAGMDYAYYPRGRYLLEGEGEDDRDLITLCPAYDPEKAAVGQRYLTRDYQIVTLDRVDAISGVAWFGGSAVYVDCGRVYRNTDVSFDKRVDLIALIPSQ